MNKSKFTVIKKTEDDVNGDELKRIYRIAKLNECWERQFFDTAFKFCKGEGATIDDLPQNVLAKIGLSGVKYICSQRTVERENKRLGIDVAKSLRENQAVFQLLDTIFNVLGNLTLRTFVTTFPIRKDYDGKKWESKDYFYTMNILSEMDWDKPIGRDVMSELLWDYENDNLRHMYVEYMCAMSAIYRSQTGKGIAEQWCEDNDIPTYTIKDDVGVSINNQTGQITRIKKRSSLQLVK